MNKVAAIISLVTLLTSTASFAQSTPSCEGLGPCVIHNGIAVIGGGESAHALLAIAQTGALQFERYLGVPVPPIAIVPGGVISAELLGNLKAAGFESSLPWISDADKKKLRAGSIRKQVLAQTEGLPEAQRQAILQQALGSADASAESESTAMSAEEEGALAHELGHLWFKAAFRSEIESDKTPGHGYGGWAPDWLDETVAILMENEGMQSGRRSAFSSAVITDFYPLEDYLTMDHPALASAAKLATSGGSSKRSGSRTIVLSGKEAEAFLAESASGDPTMFYTQTRGFIDYMTARTGNERVFMDIAEHLAVGKSFDSWLAKDGGELPQTMDALESDWANWLQDR